MSQAVTVNSLTQLDKKYRSCPNIILQHEFTIEKPNSIRKTQSLPNMKFAYYGLATKSPHYSEIEIAKACMQEELRVKRR